MRKNVLAYGGAALGVVAMSAIIHVLQVHAEMSNISLLYFLVVLTVALRLGSGPAVWASLLSFLAFNYFFVPPVSMVTVNDPGEVLALLIFLLTAGSIGQLTARLRSRAEEAQRQGREAAALTATTGAVSSELDLRRSLEEILRQVSAVAPVRTAAVLVTLGGAECVVAQWPSESTLNLPLPNSDRALRLPLAANNRQVGQLWLEYSVDPRLAPRWLPTVTSLANLAAVALERDQLIRAEAAGKALQETDRLKTALLAMVSHDFRSPLASIKASAGAYLQNEAAWDAAALRELHEGIIREADRLNSVIGNLLTMSRLDAEAWKPARERTSIWEVIEAAREGLSDAQNERIRVQFQPELPDAWLDPVQMGQVLHNLLDNALKYAPPPSLVEIRAGLDAEQVVLEILDRGPGLPPGAEHQVFERFYRAPGLPEGPVSGVGLGLSVCQGLVEAHGGGLTAAQREGGGAIFRICLPQRTEE